MPFSLQGFLERLYASAVEAYDLLQIQGRPFVGAGDGGTMAEGGSHPQLGPQVLFGSGLPPKRTYSPLACSHRTFTDVSSGDTATDPFTDGAGDAQRRRP